MLLPKSVHSKLFVISALSGGGAERTSVSLINLLNKNGHKLVVVCTENINSNDYCLNEKIPLFLISYKDKKRYEKLANIVKDFTVDTVVLTNHWRLENFQDIKWFKKLGIKVVAQEHSMFYFPLYTGQYSLFNKRLEAYKQTDALTCLSKTDQVLWQFSGVTQSLYIPNLVENLSQKSILSYASRENTILIVGRLNEIKGLYNLPVYIEKIHRILPNVQISIFGNFSSIIDKIWFFSELRRRNLTSVVKWEPFTNNIFEHIRKAKLMFIPSLIEGSPMVILEARQYGTPCLLFGLKYIDSSNNGVIHLDGLNESFNSIFLDLFHNEQFWTQFSNDALAGLENWQAERVLKIWEDLFFKLKNGVSLGDMEEDYNRQISSSMNEFYRSMSFISSKLQDEQFYETRSWFLTFILKVKKIVKFFRR